ncbi:MAG: hypothetical protein VX777_05385 [Chlamydiota bacterium]|nr:hypothetical protein [Chlamydiota bacterium]
MTFDCTSLMRNDYKQDLEIPNLTSSLKPKNFSCTNLSINMRCKSAPPSPSKEARLTGEKKKITFSKTNNFNCFTLEDLEEVASRLYKISSALKHNSLISTKDQLYFEKFHFSFIQTFHESVSIARSLNVEFQKIFEGECLPFINEINQSVVLTYDQFSVGYRMLKRVFPGLVALASQEIYQKAVAYLLKIIVTNIPEEFDFRGNEAMTTFTIEGLTCEAPLSDGVGLFCKDLEKQVNCMIKKGRLASQTTFKYLDKILYDMIKKKEVNRRNTLPRFTSNIVELFLTKLFRSKEVTLEFETGEKIWPQKGQGNDIRSFLSKFYKMCVKQAFESDQKKVESETVSFIHTLSSAMPFHHKVSEQGTALMTEKVDAIFSELPEDFRSVLSFVDTECSSWNKDVLVNFLRMKFLELVLLVTNQDETFINECVGSLFLSETLEVSQEKTRECRLKRDTLSYRFIFDKSLVCVSHFIKSQLSIDSSSGYALNISQNHGSSLLVAQVESQIVLENPSSRLFYIHRLLPKKITPIHSLNFQWVASKTLLEYITTKVDGGFLENSTEARLGVFFEQLKIIESISSNETINIDRDGRVSISRLTRSWRDWYNSITGSSSGDENSSEDEVMSVEVLRDKLFDLIEGGWATFSRFLEHVSVSDNGHEKSKYVSTRLQITLEKLKNALDQLITNLEKYNASSERDQFNKIFEFIDEKMVPNLPDVSHSILASVQDERTWVQYFSSGIVESSDPRHIDWKILRYRSVIAQFRREIGKIFSKHFPDQSQEQVLLLLKKWEFNGGLEQEFSKMIQSILYGVNLDVKPSKFNQDYLNKVRLVYKIDILTGIRNISSIINKADFQGTELQHKIANCTMDLSEFLYTKINLESESIALIQKLNDIGEKLSSSSTLPEPWEAKKGMLAENVLDMHENIQKVPWSYKAPIISQAGNSIRGHFNTFFDPISQGNIPQCIGTMELIVNGVAKKIKQVIFGSPTIENFGEAVISPEFYTWMKSYQKEGKKHLFVVNQDMRPKSSFTGSEVSRIYAIINASEEEELRDTLYVIVLSKNSDFYYQKGVYEHQSNAKIFKNNLMSEIFDGDFSKTGNFIPEKVRNKIPGFREKMNTIANDIHETMFYGKEELSIEERQIFIDIFHDYIEIVAEIGLKVDSSNTSCKDAIDRAVDSRARKWAHIGLVHDLENDTHFKEVYEAILLARAVQVRKRQTIKERVMRNVQSVNYLQTHKKPLKNLNVRVLGDIVYKIDVGVSRAA